MPSNQNKSKTSKKVKSKYKSNPIRSGTKAGKKSIKSRGALNKATKKALNKATKKALNNAVINEAKRAKNKGNTGLYHGVKDINKQLSMEFWHQIKQ
jgi:hypothetical protein